MSRFHFNIYDGRGLTDYEGTELPNWEAAQQLAIQHAGEVIRDDAKRIVADEDWRMEVTDANGLVLLRLDFSVLLSPALASGSALRRTATYSDPEVS